MPTTKPILARAIQIEDQALVLQLTDNQIVRIPWERCSNKLASANPAQRSCAELSPSGYGIHWPAIDEDLSVGGLLRSMAAITPSTD